MLSEGIKTEYTLQDIVEVRNQVKEKQNPKRFEHTLGVAYTSACMAFIYGVDPLKAEYAGLLHDCAKCFSDEQLIGMCREAGIELSKAELEAPAVIHAKYGRYMAENEFGVKDKDVLNSIEFHTTGRAAMSTLEKIVFIADFIEPLRNVASNLEEARKLAFSNIDECMYNILSSTIVYLNGRNADIVPETLKAYEYYKSIREDKNGI